MNKSELSNQRTPRLVERICHVSCICEEITDVLHQGETPDAIVISNITSLAKMRWQLVWSLRSLVICLMSWSTGVIPEKASIIYLCKYSVYEAVEETSKGER